MIQEKMKEKASYAQKLLDFFMAADTSGDGVLTLEEFEAMVEDDRIKTYLSSLELDVSQCRHLFAMLDDGDGAVDMEEFVTGALRLKGHARSQEIGTSVDVLHQKHDAGHGVRSAA